MYRVIRCYSGLADCERLGRKKGTNEEVIAPGRARGAKCSVPLQPAAAGKMFDPMGAASIALSYCPRRPDYQESRQIGSHGALLLLNPTV